MEMCYDGVLAMPKSYAAVSEEEMTYVDGGYRTGTHYYSSARTAYNDLNKLSWAFYGGAIAIGIAAPVLGALIGFNGGAVGAAIGAAVGAVGGIIAGSVVWGFGSACANGAVQAKQLGNRSCRVKYIYHNLTLSVSVY